MCSSFCEVDDFTSVRWHPSPCFSSTSIATKVSSAMNVASKIAGAPASSAACVAARRSARALCGRSMSTPPGYRARAAAPTRQPWSNRSCNTLSGCSSSASGSCTSHHSFLWHWRPEVKRDLERRYGTAVNVAQAPPRKLESPHPPYPLSRRESSPPLRPLPSGEGEPCTTSRERVRIPQQHARAATLEAAGYRVIRIANRDVTRDHLAALLSGALGDRASFPLSRRERGTGGED